MKPMLRRRAVLGHGLAATLALVGVRVRACEFWTDNLRITHPWTRATADDATSAIVCMTIDEVQVDERLIGVETPVSTGAELGGLGARPEVDLPIPCGALTQLSESGTFIRLTGLVQPLYVGRSYPIRLRFSRSGVVAAGLSVDYDHQS